MIYLRPVTPMLKSFDVRLSEWGLALVMLLVGSILLGPDELFSRPSFDLLARVASEDVWGWGTLAIGASRLVVLLINGAWRRSPHMRALTAFASVFVWTQFSLSLMASAQFTTGLAVYPVFVLMDIYIVFRAAIEARMSDEACSLSSSFDGAGDG